LRKFALTDPSLEELTEPKFVSVEILEEEEKIQLLNRDNAEEMVFEDDRLVIVEVAKKTRHPLIEHLADKYHGSVKFCSISCDLAKNELICEKTFKVSSYPSLRFYPTGSNKRYSTTQFTSSVDLDDVESEILEYLTDNTMQIMDNEHL